MGSNPTEGHGIKIDRSFSIELWSLFLSLSKSKAVHAVIMIVFCSLSLWRHGWGRHVWYKCLLRHKSPIFVLRCEEGTRRTGFWSQKLLLLNKYWQNCRKPVGGNAELQETCRWTEWLNTKPPHFALLGGKWCLRLRPDLIIRQKLVSILVLLLLSLCYSSENHCCT